MAKQTKNQQRNKRSHKSTSGSNPFESAARKGGIRSNKRIKHDVINRNPFSKQNGNNRQMLSKTQQEDKVRKTKLMEHIRSMKKSNSFRDQRIDGGMNRAIRERMSRSKRQTKFQLDDGDDDLKLTHGGQALDSNNKSLINDYIPGVADDDEEDLYDKLDAADTEMHFGGGNGGATRAEFAAYGGDQRHSLGDAYRSRKTELDEVILRSKMAKQERQKEKREQIDLFEKADAEYAELKGLLKFRDSAVQSNANPSVIKRNSSREKDDMDEWNAEMKSYLFEKRMAATDRTKTPEELAQEAAERLHELEKKRLARMAGEDDDLSDVMSDDDDFDGPEDLGEDNKRKQKDEVIFTEDGLKTFRNGKILEDDVSDDQDDDSSDQSTSSACESMDDTEEEVSLNDEKDDDDNDEDDKTASGAVPSEPLAIGQRVKANYHASEAYMGITNWYKGTIISVGDNDKYNIRYDDGDEEENVEIKNIRLLQEKPAVSERKRKRAQEMAR